MKLNKVTYSLFLSQLILLASCSPKSLQQSLWQGTPVTIDAKVSEYKEMSYYNSETKMFYSISNDTSNLYLCFKITDETIQRQIMIAGIEVWTDTTTKIKKQIGITYPVGGGSKPRTDFNDQNTQRQKPDFEKVKQNFLLTQNLMQVHGIKNPGTLTGNMQYQCGLAARLDWDNNNNMIYELKIPIENWYKKVAVSDSAKLFTLTVNINALQMPNMNGGPPGGGGGGDFPGGGRSPIGNGPMGNMMAMSEPHSFSVNFKLNFGGR